MESWRNKKNKMRIVKESIKFTRDILVSLHTFFLILVFRCKKKQNTCILVTNGMGYGGAPLVVLEAAKIYKKKGYNVVIYTEFYGDLVKVCKNENLDVWISPRNCKMFSKLIFKCNFKFALVNTAVMYKWIQKFEMHNIPTIWWLHEADSYIAPIAQDMPSKLSSNIMVLTVSDRTVATLKKYKIQYDSRMLYYGIDDMNENDNSFIDKKNGEEYVFLVMGAICSRKNQIFAIKAYNQLSENIRKKSKMLFVGEPLNKDDSYYVEFINEVKKYPNIKYIPRVERKNIPMLYRQIDALICCSIDDPLPVVVTECLMFKKNVIVSSGTGQYYMIKDGYNGYSYLESDIDSLCEKMELSWKNKNNKTLNKNARKLYIDNFTKKVFEKNIMLYTRELLNEQKNSDRKGM